MKKKILPVTIIVLIIAAVATQAVKVYISNSTQVASIKATKLSQRVSKLAADNIQLEAKVLNLSSYNNVASRAAELGFATSKDIVSVYDPVQVALGR